MNNRLALVLASLIVVVLAADTLFFDGKTPLFLAKKFVSFVEYLSFWR